MNHALAVVLAMVLDRLLGEPKRFHPLVGFGRWASWVERKLWLASENSITVRQQGVLAWVLVVIPVVLLGAVIQYRIADQLWLNVLLEAMVLYSCIAWRSLKEHAEAIWQPLQAGDLEQARAKLAYIVSRDTSELSETEVSSACCESILENGSDGIFAAIFWFLLAGIPGVLLYRAANTLDAMWGYRNERFLHFGWAAAKLDDLLNYLPARLVAFSYALLGNYQTAMDCWYKQGRNWKSPNAGPVMAAGAGSLNLLLGGVARYHGEAQQRPQLGLGEAAVAEDISRSLDLLDRTVYLWLFIVIVVGAITSV